ncbi:MAG: DUF433 domain-containing protein [Deltaproteobacteria bacterium]|nr:DUF433 domain-containing protein [Deltaproteobacteria bacterium]
MTRTTRKVTHPATAAIDHTMGMCGNRACIVGTRIPVWAIQALWLQGATDADVIAAYPNLAGLDLDSVRAYVELNADEIRRDIEDHEHLDAPNQTRNS